MGRGELPRGRQLRVRRCLALLAAAGVLLQVALNGSACLAAAVRRLSAPPSVTKKAPVRSGGAERPADVPLSAPVDLIVSSPAVLLNHIADRYSTTPRILMEFIDNALDDAEAFFDSPTNSYKRPVKVEVAIDNEAERIRITDNCRGMAPDMLRRVTTHVGESKKRGQSFVNGQFGFGMQAFRACCRELTVRSRTQKGTPALQIQIDRDQSSGFVLRQVSASEYGHVMPNTGTTIEMNGFDAVWKSGDNELSVKSFAEEIEMHFERLLARGNLEVAVTNKATKEHYVCQPVHYASRDTEVVIDETIDLGGGQVAQVLLAVGDMTQAEEMKRPSRFFAKGRRIGKTAELRSFFMGSKNRWTVWNNAQVMGYIDVLGNDNGPLRPVITRDEFKRSQGRSAAFEAIMRFCEQPLLDAIEKANVKRNDNSMKGLEDALTSALSRMSNEERRKRSMKPDLTELEDLSGGWEEHGDQENASEPWYVPLSQAAEKKEPKEKLDRDKDNKNSPDRKKESPPVRRRLRADDFRVKLVKGISQPDDPDPVRSTLLGNEILVDVMHPDFKKRFKRSRTGAPRVDERVCGYLASVVSAHYRDASYAEFDEIPQSRLESFQDLIGDFCALEERLQKVLPQLAKEMELLDVLAD